MQCSASLVRKVIIMSICCAVCVGAASRNHRLVAQDHSGMVHVPAGTFVMGSPPGVGKDDETPQRTAHLSGFWIDKTDVTNEQYGKFLAWITKTPDHSRCFNGEPPGKDHTPLFWNDSRFNGPQQPVVGVDWFDAYAYAAWAGKRLPTEAEWERAARGTDGRVYPWGNEWNPAKCCSADAKRDAPADVGSYPDGASPVGCLDMAGNVWEWCADWYVSRYDATTLQNPSGPAQGIDRVLRGGSWINAPSFCRTTARLSYSPYLRFNFTGFRCVVSD